MARFFLHAEFHELQHFRRHASDCRWRDGDRLARSSRSTQGIHGGLVPEERVYSERFSPESVRKITSVENPHVQIVFLFRGMNNHEMGNGLQHDDKRCFVAARLLQHYPQRSSHVIRVKSLPLQWTELDPCMGDHGLLSSWLDDGSEEDSPQRIHWRAVRGIGLALAMGAGFWAGLGLLISRIA